MNAGFGKPNMGSRATKASSFSDTRTRDFFGAWRQTAAGTGRVPAGSLALRRGTGLVGGGGWGRDKIVEPRMAG